uniref:Uncharacterized protein n=1 Tax=Euplotes harpa TaxID=151035 RepID=A0A7S3NDU6_9SPIT|mmetsp:Transcript_41053/g.47232  ORF Transcript_41053/g.47232 Transcript_41053/m.47232 type:complete len:210 (+) Transcript_41053:780-1409(+)
MLSEFNLDSISKFSLAKVDKIESNTISISGAKIVNNSYIVNLANIESMTENDAQNKILSLDNFHQKILKKIFEADSESKSLENLLSEELATKIANSKSVEYSYSAMKELREIVGQMKLDFYDSIEEVMALINSVLVTKPFCIKTNTKSLQREICAVALDNLTIIYEDQEDCIKVFKIVWSTYFIETGSCHTKDWLDSLSNALNFEKMLQ